MKQSNKKSDTWQLQEAKAKFSKLIRAAAHRPQFVSVRGEEEAVVISKKEYQHLLGQESNFIDFLNQSPLKGLELVLERDKSTGREINL